MFVNFRILLLKFQTVKAKVKAVEAAETIQTPVNHAVPRTVEDGHPVTKPQSTVEMTKVTPDVQKDTHVSSRFYS